MEFYALTRKSNVVFFGENSMNKSFKVVFNKARGALMVVNEVTSSVQAKGTKTVIAATVAALAAGVAGATEIPEIPEGVKADTVEVTDWKDIDAQNVFKTEAQKIVMFHTVKDHKVFEGDLWVVSEGENTSAKGFYVVGADADFINEGNIYITSEKSWKNQAILADAGSKATNEGLIVAKNAYGMTVGTTGNGDKGSTIINNGRIAQFADPQTIIREPADDFIRQFILSQLMVKRTNILKLFSDSLPHAQSTQEQKASAAPSGAFAQAVA